MYDCTLNEYQRLYELAQALLASDYQRPLTLALVARGLSISPRQLQRVYAEFSKRSFRAELLARRMSVAAELLAGSTLGIGEVARRVGYRHESHFARAFRAHHGLSPSAFRLQARRRERSWRVSVGLLG